MNTRKVPVVVALLMAATALAAGVVAAQEPADSEPQAALAAVGTAFTYQGRLTDAGSPANGAYDFEFRLYDAASGGSQVGSTVPLADVTVSNGLFTVQLDFGAAAFQRDARWLEIGVRPGAGSDACTTLSPRQALTAAPYALHAADAWSVNGNRGNNQAFNFLGTVDEQPLVIKTNNGEQVRVLASGDVGIGTASPDSKLQISYNSGSQGLHLVNYWGSGGETDIKLSTAEPNGVLDKSWFIRTGGSARGDVAAGSFGIAESYIPLYRLFIQQGGNVGIGTVSPNARLTVRGAGTSNSTLALRVENAAGSDLLRVSDSGAFYFRLSGASNTYHLCASGTDDWLTPGSCSSAAEYVPSVDLGLGHPQAADVVSIVPAMASPYGDQHAPFVVAKSTQACDGQLLGFIVNPDSRADGTKLNDHYLPLAIYGYFPVKVTVANGPIRRGDPLTSSSIPGRAMRATAACKIIGYALEDADGDGTIQVFAHLSDNSALQVESLTGQLGQARTALAQLESRVNTLEGENAALAARLAALESALQALAASGNAGSPSTGAALAGGASPGLGLSTTRQPGGE